MVIGIDASRAFLKNRTGIEEYSYQVIKHLIKELKNNQVVLYVRENSTNYEFYENTNDLKLPSNWKVKTINWPYLWTQLGLSLEMLLHPVDALFVPAHTVPLIHPKKTVVTIHGLEYEFCPQAYSFWGRLYMRCTIRKSCQWASSIVAASENTKKDLMRLYNADDKKIQVIYEGYDNNFQFPISNFQSNSNFQNSNLKIDSKFKIQNSKFLLFIGRLEERKNIIGIINAFETLKENYKISHKLVLAGKPGFGYEKIKDRIENSNSVKDIVELGFVSEEEKWELLKNAAVFVFPTLYEGFGIPVLEAQSVGCPVVASNNSSIPEIVSLVEVSPRLRSRGETSAYSALLVDPHNAEEIAESIQKIISNEREKNDIIQKGYENVKRFSWDKCASEVSEILRK